MAFSCSQCSFTAQFESALTMHHQLHHETATKCVQDNLKNIIEDNSKTIPRPRDLSPPSSLFRRDKDLKLLAARITPSATKFFSRIKSRICRSKTTISVFDEERGLNDISTRSDCTSKAMKGESASLILDGIKEREIYSCHLCDFNADRITVLDRHLLTDHKLTLESLLQLVICKTKEGLEEPSAAIKDSRRPYYRPADTVISNGDYYIETVTPKIKVLKNTAVNTELTWLHRPEFADASDYSIPVNRDMENVSSTQDHKGDEMNLLQKMASLNEFMCKFVESSNTLKKALSRDESKWRRESSSFHIDDTPREWGSAHSERTDRHRRRRHEWPLHLKLDESPRERAHSERSERHYRSKVKHRSRREPTPTPPFHLQLDE